MREVRTPGGCRVRLYDTGIEHLGPGRLLALDMDQPGDGRHAEVHLSPANMRDLVVALNLAQSEEMRLALYGTWLVEDLGRCTCAGMPYGHEYTCGSEPITDLSTLPGWKELVTQIRNGEIG